MKAALLALILALTIGTTSVTAQAPTSTLRGRVVRSGTGEVIPNAKVSVNTLETFQTLSGVAAASSTLILGREASETAVRYLTMPTEELDAQMAQFKAISVTPDLVTAINQLQAARSRAPGFPRIAISDSVGRFSFDNIPPGRYMVVTEREGFYGVPTAGANVLQYATAAVDVTNQQATPEIAITMISGALISGRVRDANGQPLVNVNVQAFTTTYKAGLPVLEAVTEKTTDDKGEFRLFWLPAGEYLIAATPRPVAPGLAPGATNQAVIKTFHPSAPQPTLAMPIKVKVGDEVAGIDIEMRTVRAVKISGQVVSSLGPRTDLPPGFPAPVPVATLMLLQRDPSVPDDTRNSVIGTVNVATGTGRFELSGILPGVYDFYSRIPDPRGSVGQGGQAQAWGRRPIEVLDRDLTDVTLVVHASVEVKGLLTINGAAPGAAGSTIRVALQPDGSSSKMPNYNGVLGRPATPSAAEGAFTIPGVAEANYRFVVNGLPANAYVDDIRSGARSVYDSGIYVTDRTPDTVQIVVNGAGGIVEGSVATADRKPSPNSTVVLVPESSRRQNAMLYKTATANAQGEFSIRGVRPGNYRVFAWESVADGAYLNPVFMSKYESRGVVVNVSASSSSNATVTVIPKN